MSEIAPPLPDSAAAPAAAVRPDPIARWQDALAQAHTARGRRALRWLNPQPPLPATATRQRHPRRLEGWQMTVKDLFDVQGQTTAAGSLVLAEAAPAQRHALAVQRLLHAGAHLMGRSHMVEFAFSGMGPNPHFAPLFAVDARHAPAGQPFRALEDELVSGGSSSGAALSVALGVADIGLGSDTGGSIRIPAAFNGLVGFKSTQALVPREGMLPLSPSLDVACALTRDVASAIAVHEVLAARTVTRSPVPLPAWRLAVVENFFFDDSDTATRQAFWRTVEQLQQTGASIARITLPELDTLAEMARLGTLPAAESHAWHHSHGLLPHASAPYDPRVRQRIEAGARISATDYLRLQQLRCDWQARMALALAGFDAVLSPTVAITAPRHAEVAPGAERDVAFARLNRLVLRNTSAINLLDGSAISLPCHAPHELPVGLMLWSLPGRDDTVLNVALRVEQVLAASAPPHPRHCEAKGRGNP